MQEVTRTGTAGQGTPLISLRGIRREFPSGDEVVAVLRDVDIDIHAGEMVAIIGSSGSGKSTLMNILGCLDRPSAGTYRFDGRDVATFTPEEQAALRREHFGFIFQRYQLLPELDAVENVEIPAVYAGAARGARRSRARALLERLGLGGRLDHRPSQLSGGQQQRVSVARALMNGGEVILADEPTGALDSRSGKDLMALLAELHAAGHTLIIVTHDPEVASHAERVIEIADGEIVADRRNGAETPVRPVRPERPAPGAAFGAALDRLREAGRMAVKAMAAHRLRTFLTMLGIIIGIASVVSVVALGTGSQEKVLENISSIGTNTIEVRSGRGFGDMRSGRVQTLMPSDADALALQPYADSVSPRVSSSATALYRDVAASVSVQGVGAGFFRVGGYDIVEGVAFGPAAVTARAQEAVIDTATRDELFPGGGEAVGAVVMLGRVPVRIIGVASSPSAAFGRSSLNVWIPYTTALGRVLGQAHLDQISVRIADDYDMETAEALISELLEDRHGTVDFFLMNTDTIRATIQSTAATLTLLVSLIAVISLLVGGIGVMNIMLVSVTERTREIGVRMAVGARQGDILAQFLIEAVLVCLIGGTLGVLAALGIGAGIGALTDAVRLSYSGATILAAFLSSLMIGVVFGFLPARSAARLDPVQALMRE